MADFTIEQHNPAYVEQLRPLWLAMKEHHGSITPGRGPVRDDEDSWARRRADYVKWLAEPDAFCLVARDPEGTILGYALVTVNDGSATWAAVDRFGYLESLSVLPRARGQGVGAALLRAAEDHLATLGVEHVEITLVAANEDARRFYEREGYGPAFLTVQRRSRRTP
jgi:GNAT superfamily N-acetyltransferase